MGPLPLQPCNYKMSFSDVIVDFTMTDSEDNSRPSCKFGGNVDVHFKAGWIGTEVGNRNEGAI